MRENWAPVRTTMLGLTFVSTLAATVLPAWAGDDDDESGWSESISNSIKNTFGGIGNKLGMNRPAAPPPAESPSGCPTITILSGTESQRVMAAGATGNSGVRYQYSLANVGRQCSIAAGQVAIKVGADGRVLLGPMGSAGRFDIPIRIVVFSEADQKPVQSKLYKVAASIPAGQSGAPFEFVSDNFWVPIAAGRSAKDYSIKIGFDSKGGGDVVPTKHAHHRKQKDVENASAQQ